MKTTAYSKCVFAAVAFTCLSGSDWLQFRGSLSSSVSPDTNVPTTFDEKNIALKVELPGRGLSSPIIVGDKVIVTACSGYHQDQLHVLCFSVSNGDELWRRDFVSTGRSMTHPKTSTAAPTPASDGERVFALFSTNDLVCLDLDGNLEWLRGLTQDYPNASNSLGMASSPIVAADTVIVQIENDSQSLALGVSTKTGVNRWKVERPSLSNWTSPTLIGGQKNLTVVLQSGRGMKGYNPKTGEERWSFNEGCSTIPSSAVAGDVIVVPSNGLTALRPSAESTGPEILWRQGRMRPGTASPIVYDGTVYSIASNGVLKAAELATGKEVWQSRVRGPFSGTPVIANGHMYLFNEDGVGQVVDLKKKKLSHEYELGDTILCTPAIADGAIYVRSDKHLYKIAATN